MWATGLQSSAQWDVILICSFSSKQCKNIRGHQKSQTLFMLDIDKPLSAVYTEALAPHPAYGVKLYWDMGNSHVTCYYFKILNGSEQEKSFFRNFSYCYFRKIILCSASEGKKSDLRRFCLFVFFLLACCFSIKSLCCAVSGFNIN